MYMILQGSTLLLFSGLKQNTSFNGVQQRILPNIYRSRSLRVGRLQRIPVYVQCSCCGTRAIRHGMFGMLLPRCMVHIYTHGLLARLPAFSDACGSSRLDVQASTTPFSHPICVRMDRLVRTTSNLFIRWSHVISNHPPCHGFSNLPSLPPPPRHPYQQAERDGFA